MRIFGKVQVALLKNLISTRLNVFHATYLLDVEPVLRRITHSSTNFLEKELAQKLENSYLKIDWHGMFRCLE